MFGLAYIHLFIKKKKIKLFKSTVTLAQLHLKNETFFIFYFLRTNKKKKKN